MTEDQDNAGEVVAATVRVALTAAGQLAEQGARRREAALRNAEKESVAQVATLRAQLAAERQAALGSVKDILRRGDAASVDELALAWQQLRSWDDPVAIADQNRIRGLVRDRFGVEPDIFSGGRARLKEQVRAQGGDVPAAAAVLAKDTAGQREDAERRTSGADDRLSALTTPLEDAGIDPEVAHARALAAQSHPTAPALAAQPSAAAPRVKRRPGKRKSAVEVQSPGR